MSKSIARVLLLNIGSDEVPSSFHSPAKIDTINEADAEPVEGPRAAREIEKAEAFSARLSAEADALEGLLRVAEGRGLKPGQPIGDVLPELKPRTN